VNIWGIYRMTPYGICLPERILRMMGVIWGVDNDGAPNPTICVNIGDTCDFNPSQIYCSLS
jgi:hypothetical protein